MIVIPVMHGEFAQVLAAELPATATTDMRIHFQGLFAIALLAQIPGALRIGKDPVQSVVIFHLKN